MTDPVSQAEMIAAVRASIRQHELNAFSRESQAQVRILRNVLALVERHERAMAVVEAARDFMESRNSCSTRCSGRFDGGADSGIEGASISRRQPSSLLLCYELR